MSAVLPGRVSEAVVSPAFILPTDAQAECQVKLGSGRVMTTMAIQDLLETAS